MQCLCHVCCKGLTGLFFLYVLPQKVPINEKYSASEEYQTYARPYSAIFNFVRNTTQMTFSEIMQWTPDFDDLYARRQICAKTLYWEGMEHIIERISIPKVMASAAILLRSI